MRCSRLVRVVLLLALPAIAQAQARFDLAGPKIDVEVTRAGVTLPITRVPTLLPGDQLRLHPRFPADQSAHYLLIAAFLRGTTNPPPDNWFTRIDTWDRKVREEGILVTVPPDAQQAILFLAPETGGDFATLRSAVKGRPGIFVRAAQDLTETGFEQARIETYLESMKQVPPGDPAAIIEHSNLLARTLSLRPNPECFKRPLDQQYTCLTQTGSQQLLDDGHAQTMMAALSTGPGSDFINQASTTRLAAGGNYSAYVGAIVDLGRILNGLHTAVYQYIPAIAFPDPSAPDALSLRLNTAPSFHNPKSVIVIGLPPVTPATLPPLRPADPSHISCLPDPHMVLPIEGAPLVFSTAYARDLQLVLKSTAVPLTPDAYQGGLALAPSVPSRRELPPVPSVSPDPARPEPASPASPAGTEIASVPGAPVEATITGFWGFDRFTGPAVRVQQLPGQAFGILPQDSPILTGQANHLQLTASGTACIRAISIEPTSANVDWKLDTKSSLPKVDLSLNLQHTPAASDLQLQIQQFGAKEPVQVAAKALTQPAKLAALTLHQGDTTAMLKGSNLAQVKSVALADQTYLPNPADPASLTTNKASDSKPGDHLTAKVTLNDGRVIELAATILPPRPQITLLSRRVVLAAPTAIQLSTPDDLPLGAQLMFFLKSKTPFPRAGSLEIAAVPSSEASGTGDEAPLKTTLSVAAGTLILQDAHTLLATFDPLKLFGPSTYGAFRLRALSPDGTEGAWLPLATIVRLPTLNGLTCSQTPAPSCTLAGSGLYLIDAISPDLTFSAATKVPEGYVDPTLSLPRLANGTFYLRLRDDLLTTHQVNLPLTADTPTRAQATLPGKR